MVDIGKGRFRYRIVDSMPERAALSGQQRAGGYKAVCVFVGRKQRTDGVLILGLCAGGNSAAVIREYPGFSVLNKSVRLLAAAFFIAVEHHAGNAGFLSGEPVANFGD